MPRLTVNVIGLDDEKIYKEVLYRGFRGLVRATEYTLGRAKYHAPVRAIFTRSRRGPEIPRGRDVPGRATTGWRYIRSERQYKAFLASKERRIGMNLPPGSNLPGAQSGGSFNTTYKRRRPDAPLIKELHTRTSRRSSIGGPGGAGYTGHRNTLFPVFRMGRYRVTGDFRRVAGPKEAYAQGPYGSSAFSINERRGILKMAAKSLPLSAAGRREFRRATGGSRNARLAANSGLYKGRIGGRLRGELTISGPVQKGTSLWMYVESPTPYAVHQEFGTTRHRAQPFLRPALYESREVLRREVRKSIADPRRRLDRSDDPRTSYRKRAVN